MKMENTALTPRHRKFDTQLCKLLNKTLDVGPGARAVTQITTEALVDFIFGEAGTVMAPTAVEEVHEQIRQRILWWTAAANSDPSHLDGVRH